MKSGPILWIIVPDTLQHSALKFLVFAVFFVLFFHIISFDPAELLVGEKPDTIAVYWKVEPRFCFWN